MSREVAEQEERMRRGDNLRLQMALEESRKSTIKMPKKKESQQQTSLLDLVDALPSAATTTSKPEPWARTVPTNSHPDPWGGAAASPASSDPWQSFAGAKTAAPADPWGANSGSSTQPLPKNADPWAPPQCTGAANSTTDPWGPAPAIKASVSSTGSASFAPFSNLNGAVKDDFSEFDSLRSSSKISAESISTSSSLRSGTASPDMFDCQPLNMAASKHAMLRKTPESFLGPNAALVNLETLVTLPPQAAPTLNPFLASGAPATAVAATPPVNPFQVNQPQALTLNQLRSSPMMGDSPSFNTVPAMSAESAPSVVPAPLGVSPQPAAPAMGLGLNMSVAGTLPQPHHSSAIPSSAAQAMNATNPFLL
ncbi:epsin-2 isoform X3 [Ascaphus truei]|uniref:epsin-2 isoform X3 n=1 Tax=Ascaphus truei TaxID=8439 RepID=UPI003F5984E3